MRRPGKGETTFLLSFQNVLFQDIYFLSSRYEAEYMKNRKKGPPEDKTPKFEFYLYNDAGRIIKQYLSIHEIQQILLQQSQNLGGSVSNLLCIHQIFLFRAPAACLAYREKRVKLETNRAAKKNPAHIDNNSQDTFDNGNQLNWEQLSGWTKQICF